MFGGVQRDTDYCSNYRLRRCGLQHLKADKKLYRADITVRMEAHEVSFGATSWGVISILVPEYTSVELVGKKIHFRTLPTTERYNDSKSRRVSVWREILPPVFHRASGCQ